MDTEVMDLETRALSAPNLAKPLLGIRTPEQYAAAGKFVVWLKDLRKAVAAAHNPGIHQKHLAHQAALGDKARLDDPLAQTEAAFDRPMRDYLALERRQREDNTRIAEAAARKAEEDARLAEAEQAEKAGDHAEAEALIQAPVVVPSVVVPRAVPKVDGLTTTPEWHWKVTDLALIPDHYWIPRTLDTKAIDHAVKSRKTLANIPGIEVWSEEKPRGARRT